MNSSLGTRYSLRVKARVRAEAQPATASDDRQQVARRECSYSRVAEAPSHASAVLTEESLRSADIRTRPSGCDAVRDYAGSDTDDA